MLSTSFTCPFNLPAFLNSHSRARPCPYLGPCWGHCPCPFLATAPPPAPPFPRPLLLPPALDPGPRPFPCPCPCLCSCPYPCPCSCLAPALTPTPPPPSAPAPTTGPSPSLCTCPQPQSSPFPLSLPLHLPIPLQLLPLPFGSRVQWEQKCPFESPREKCLLEIPAPLPSTAPGIPGLTETRYNRRWCAMPHVSPLPILKTNCLFLILK